MTGYKEVNLQYLVETQGEDATKSILSDFSCPLNEDVEKFLKDKSIEFMKQGISATHLILASHKDCPVIVGYYTLSQKIISIKKKEGMSRRVAQRFSKFGKYNSVTQNYDLPATLIGQLGKNFTNGYNELITGDELLQIAINKIKQIQFALGGRWIYLECEDKPELINFYKRNNFQCFGKRMLDRDETGLNGEYLIQFMRYHNT